MSWTGLDTIGLDITSLMKVVFASRFLPSHREASTHLALRPQVGLQEFPLKIEQQIGDNPF